MTTPIKHCPQPDPPELVMRADGYHYRTEDEMDDLTLMQQAITALENEDLSKWSDDMDRVTIASLRAAIAADRALNAPADRDVMQLPTYEVRSGSVNGRLAKQPYSQGDALPAIGSFCLVSGANCDIESDQHRAFYWKKVVGYADGFVCLQVDGCWPTVERLTNCWFAEIPNPAKAAAPTPKKS